MKVEIDENSGFCFGVVNAIAKAEEELQHGQLYCIGDIVHNSLEVERLKNLGLSTINHEEFARLKACRVLFRAHGEPPISYELAKRNGIEVIDASCPVVLNLQKKIREAYENGKADGVQIVIYGKRGHAEVNGLVAQTHDEALIIEGEEDLMSIDLTRPVILFSQTTKSLEGFKRIVELVKEKAQNTVVVNDTICRKVANRIPQLEVFAAQHDVILFVSGEKSSNGKQLFEVCKGVNPRTYFVQSVEDLNDDMFVGANSVGISGATSTPRWVMEEIQFSIKYCFMGKIQKIGVLTSGGDAPGMNAAIRAVVRAAIFNGCEAYGIYDGYEGLIEGNIVRFESHDVSNIIQRGGTILKTARSAEFRTPEGRAKAYDKLKEFGIDALVVIGGDGTFSGARLFCQEHNVHVVGIPGTIDNDLYGTDYTIGYDTAVNTVVEAVDKIRDTASAHNRLFFIEVMGRDAGFIALRSAVATGAEAVLVPEIETDVNDLDKYLEHDYKPHKSSGIVIVAEGDKSGGAYTIADQISKKHPEYDVRVTVLGHIQRGGSPSAFDRVTASTLGVAAVDALLDDQTSIMVGIMNKDVVHVPFNKAIKNSKALNQNLVGLTEVLSI